MENLTAIPTQDFEDIIWVFALCVRMLSEKLSIHGITDEEAERIKYCLKLIEPLLKKYA